MLFQLIDEPFKSKFPNECVFMNIYTFFLPFFFFILPTKKEFINIDISNNTFKEKVLHDIRLDGMEFNQILRNSYAKCFFLSIFKLMKLEKIV